MIVHECVYIYHTFHFVKQDFKTMQTDFEITPPSLPNTAVICNRPWIGFTSKKDSQPLRTKKRTSRRRKATAWKENKNKRWTYCRYRQAKRLSWCQKNNLFVKPNELAQSWQALSDAMARKGRMKSNVLFLKCYNVATQIKRCFVAVFKEWNIIVNFYTANKPLGILYRW